MRNLVSVLTVVGIGISSAGEIDPSQKEWFGKYKKQVNSPDPGEMLLNTDSEPKLKEGFVSLLNGKDLSNWGIWGGQSEFEYKDGVVTGTCVPGQPSSYLCTHKNDYEDFIFTCEMKWAKDLNSGVMFRGQFHEDTSAVLGPQVEMEGIKNARGWSGGIYGQSCGGYWYPLWLKEHTKVRSSLKTEGWNRVTVMAKGNTVKTWLNGVPAAHWVGDGTYSKGYFGLQVHKAKSGKVLWRDLKVKELGEEADRLRELDAYWREVSRTVGEGDFEGYAATCHEDGVLISGTKQTSEPLASALKRWKTEFDQTKAGTMKASVDFRFKRRWGNAVTAHETGMFRYAQKVGDAEERVEYIHLKALLSKKDGKWLVLMEHQEKRGLKEEWDELGMPRWVMGGIKDRPAIKARISQIYPRLNELEGEGKLYPEGVVPDVTRAIERTIFHEGQELKEAIQVFGTDPELRADWMIVDLDSKKFLLIPLESHDSKLDVIWVPGSQWHLALEIDEDDEVGSVALKHCNSKSFVLRSIPIELFSKSDLAKRLK